MRKIIFLCAAVLLTYGSPVQGQQSKVAALAFTTSSNEALITFNEALQINDFGEAKQARALFEKAISQDPRFVAANLFLANLAASPKEFVQYMDKAKSQLHRASDWEKLFYDYTETVLTNNQVKRLETAQKMVAMNPGDVRSLTLLGEAYQAGNDVQNARKSFQLAVEADPSSPLGYRGLVDTYLFQDPKEFKKAEHNASKLVSLKSGSASYILLGDAYRAQGHLQKAKNAYGKAIDTDAESPTALYKRGHAYTFLGDYDKARADYAKAAMLDVVATTAIMFEAFTYLYEGQPAKGLQFIIAESARLETGDPAKTIQAQYELLNVAAKIAFHIGDKSTLDKIVLLMEPLTNDLLHGIDANEAKLLSKSDVLYCKASDAIANEDYDKANLILEEMKTTLEPIQNNRKFEPYEFLKGMISYRKKDFADAEKHFEQTGKDNIYTKYWLAKSFEAIGQGDKATSLYKEIIRYNFNGVDFALIRNDVRSRF